MLGRVNFQVSMAVILLCLTALLSPRFALAHCDTLDGPVIKDARVALDKGDITPVLKWVRQKDELQIKKAFKQALAAGNKGSKAKETGEHRFFEALVKIHRAGEGAPFTGLKPAGEVEPVIAEADKALAAGSSDSLVKMVTDTVSQGLRQRYEKVAETMKHKDESVEKGREFVKAYVEYTHYAERIQQDAEVNAFQHGSASKGHNHDDGHEKHQPVHHH